MEINIKEMSLTLSRLGKLVEEYELNHLSYYNELNTSGAIWNSTNREVMFDEANKQKAQISFFIDFLKNYILIFYRTINDLSFFGDYIKIDLQSKDKVLEKINELINTYDEILKLYEQISYEDSSIHSQKDIVKIMYETTLDMKDILNNIFTKTDDINIFMKSKIDSLDTIIIKEEEIL